jgi:hypothetical protein
LPTGPVASRGWLSSPPRGTPGRGGPHGGWQQWGQPKRPHPLPSPAMCDVHEGAPTGVAQAGAWRGSYLTWPTAQSVEASKQARPTRQATKQVSRMSSPVAKVESFPPDSAAQAQCPLQRESATGSLKHRDLLRGVKLHQNGAGNEKAWHRPRFVGRIVLAAATTLGVLPAFPTLRFAPPRCPAGR